MHPLDADRGHRPAKGLLRLTWPQVEILDAKISSLCALTEQTHGEAKLVIVIKNGIPRFVEMQTSEVWLPTRRQ